MTHSRTLPSGSRQRRRMLVIWVAALLSVIGLGEARSAAAAVIYVDIVPDHVWFKPYFLDLDSDGQMDLLFDHQFGCVGNCLSDATLEALNGGGILKSNADDVTAMNAGVIVGPSASTFGSRGLLAEDRFFGDPPVYISEQGEWDNNRTAFAGFRFLNASGVHYGWIRAFVAETSNDITVLDYAYEDRADTAIAAGARAVPEPAVLSLMLLGACGLTARGRRVPRTSRR
jgi:hypothetical protein